MTNKHHPTARPAPLEQRVNRKLIGLATALRGLRPESEREPVAPVPAPAAANASRRVLVGYQIANAQGENIQGDDGDPSGYASYEILSERAARAVLEKTDGNYLLCPIYEGDIEEPTFIA